MKLYDDQIDMLAHYVIGVCANRIGCYPSKEEARKIVESSKRIQEQVVWYNPSDEEFPDMDTAEREDVLDAVANKYVSDASYWPINGDSKEYKEKFYDLLMEEIKHWTLYENNSC